MQVQSIVKRLVLVPSLALLGAMGLPSAASATPTTTSLSSYDLPPCQASWLVDGIALRTYNNGDFKVAVRPTEAARWLSTWNRHEIWHEVQACVPGLTGTVADRIYAQLVCHADLSAIGNPLKDGEYYTGETWDLESWKDTPRESKALLTFCAQDALGYAEGHESGSWHIYFGPEPEGYDASEGTSNEPAPPPALRAVSVAFTQGLGLWTRTSPYSGAGLIEVLPEGTQMDLICQTHGENVSDWITSDIWDKVRLGNGSEVWVSDVFVNTGTDAMVGPAC